MPCRCFGLSDGLVVGVVVQDVGCRSAIELDVGYRATLPAQCCRDVLQLNSRAVLSEKKYSASVGLLWNPLAAGRSRLQRRRRLVNGIAAEAAPATVGAAGSRAKSKAVADGEALRGRTGREVGVDVGPFPAIVL